MSANLIPISSDGGFVTGGNINVSSTLPVASPAPSINGFDSATFAGNVKAGNLLLTTSGNSVIQAGLDTVVSDGINSIALSAGAQMDVYGFPFSTLTRGRLTISGNISTTEALGTWYYQSINTNTYVLYTDSTYTTLVDATGWTPYTGGGAVDITKNIPASNVIIDSNGFLSKFTNNGQVILPGVLNTAGDISGSSISAVQNITAGGNLDIDGEGTIGGNLTIVGNIDFSGGGSINQITSPFGYFTGNSDGSNALYAGVPGGTIVPNAVAQFTGDANAYMQVNMQNKNHGTQASIEYVITGDLGNDTTDYLDIGFASSTWDGTQDNSLGTAVSARDGWMYVQGGGGGGNLILGTTTSGRSIKFNAGGPNSANTIATISSTGFSTAGNVTAGYLKGEGGNISNLQVGNISGLGNLATINKDGNASNILYGNGVFAGITSLTNGNSNVVVNANSNVIISTNGNASVMDVGADGRVRMINGAKTIGGNIVAGDGYIQFSTSGLSFLSGNLQLLAGGYIKGPAGTNVIQLNSPENSSARIQGNLAVGASNTGAIYAGTITASGNANIGNIGTGALVASGDITTTGNMSATGSITGGNLTVTGNVVSLAASISSNLSVLIGTSSTGASNIVIGNNYANAFTQVVAIGNTGVGSSIIAIGNNRGNTSGTNSTTIAIGNGFSGVATASSANAMLIGIGNGTSGANANTLINIGGNTSGANATTYIGIGGNGSQSGSGNTYITIGTGQTGTTTATYIGIGNSINNGNSTKAFQIDIGSGGTANGVINIGNANTSINILNSMSVSGNVTISGGITLTGANPNISAGNLQATTILRSGGNIQMYGGPNIYLLASANGGIRANSLSSNSTSYFSLFDDAVPANNSRTIYFAANGNSDVTSNTTIYIGQSFAPTTLNMSAEMITYGNITQYNNSYFTTNGNVTAANLITTRSFVRSATAIANNAWTTNGIALKIPTATYTDNSTATGTQASSYVSVLGAPALAFSNTVTVTNAATLFVAAPTAGTNATITNSFAMIASGNVSVTGNISATNIGNIARINIDGDGGNVLYGNGVFAPGGAGGTYGNSNVATFLASYGSNTITTTGNVSVGNITATNLGNISAVNLTGSTSNVLYGNGVFAAPTGGTSSNIANGTSNVNISTSGGNVQLVSAGNSVANITGTGANIAGTISVSGNANVGNIGSAGVITATGGITGGFLNTGGNISGSNLTINPIGTGVQSIIIGNGYSNTSLVQTIDISPNLAGSVGSTIRILPSPGGTGQPSLYMLNGATGGAVNFQLVNNHNTANGANVYIGQGTVNGNMTITLGTNFSSTSTKDLNLGIGNGFNGNSTGGNGNMRLNLGGQLVGANARGNITIGSQMGGDTAIMTIAIGDTSTAAAGNATMNIGIGNNQGGANGVTNIGIGNNITTGNTTKAFQIDIGSGGNTKGIINIGNSNTSTTFGGTVTRSGAITSTAWTTSGIGLKLSAATYTDNSTAAGTQASSYVHIVDTPTLAFSNSVTVTNAATMYVAAPTAGTNATFTSSWAMIANGNIQVNGTAGVITPNLPAFRVTGSVSTSWGPNVTITSTQGATVDYNQGSYYNNTTGTFTAPVAGLYQINISGRNASNSSSYSQLVAVKNLAGTSSVQCMLEFGASSSMDHAGVSTVAKLAVNDTLNLRVLVGTIQFDANDNWTVTFLG